MRKLLGMAVIGFLVASTALAAPSSSSQKLALEALLKRSEATHSDAMVIWQDGREIGHYYKGGKAPGPIDLMSVTKSVVALGVAQLVAEGKIKSFDQPVADFYPEWRQGRKKNITIRMLMNHTSSMQNVMNATVEIYPAPDSRRGFTSLQRSIAAESPFAGKFVLLASEYLCRANKLPAEFADFYGNVAMDLLAEGARSRDAPRRV